jgi:hypothetical protein
MVVSTSLRVTTRIEDCDVLVEVILNTEGVVNTLGFPRRPNVSSNNIAYKIEYQNIAIS